MNRIERKFVLENGFKSKNVVLGLQKNYSIKKIFNPREINTIYFDTNKFDYLYDNLSGIKNRVKSRIRFYSNKNDQMIYEEKYKNNEIGFKSKINLTLKKEKPLNYENSLESFKKSKIYLNSKYFLKETLFVKYYREYFTDIFGNFITHDTKIEFFDVKFFKKSISYDKSVIEYKINEKNFRKNFFYNFNIRYSRHSKYVVGMALLNKTSYV